MMTSNLKRKVFLSAHGRPVLYALLALTFVLLYKTIELFIRSVKSILRVLDATFQVF